MEEDGAIRTVWTIPADKWDEFLAALDAAEPAVFLDPLSGAEVHDEIVDA